MVIKMEAAVILVITGSIVGSTIATVCGIAVMVD